LRKHQHVENVLVEEHPFALSGSSQEKAGEGVYVSATTSGNKRYYGVLIDQPALKEASQMWMQDQADSLELNKRIKVMMHQKREAPAAASGGATSDTSESADKTMPASTQPAHPTAAPSASINSDAAVESSSALAPAVTASTKRPAEPTVSSESETKRPKLDTNGTSSSTPAETTANVATALSTKAKEDKPVQKFKFVWNRKAKFGQNGEQEDPGYRVLVATFCSVEEAAGGDPIKSRSIEAACEEGGNFLHDDNYYYQYEVLPATLIPPQSLSSEFEMRTSMGMHSFFHNTPLPPWFPLSNLQMGQHKILSMLNMKRDNSGKVTWENKHVDTSSSDAVAAAMRGGTRLPMQPRPRKEYRIGVIGGGIAGLACCRELVMLLSNEGIDAHVTLMEARPRLGGRLWTDNILLGEDKKPFPIELGASWIHGIDDNPLAALAKQANIDFVTASEEVQMLGKDLSRLDSKTDERMGKLFDTLLDHAADDSWGAPETILQSTPQTAVRWYSSVFTGDKKDESANEQQAKPLGVPPHRRSSDYSIDIEVGKAIAKYKLRDFSKLSDIEHRMLLWNTKNVEYALGANISDLSMKFWDSDERHAFEGDHVLLKQGYSAIVDHMFDSLQKEGKAKFECLLNFPVGKVEYARKSVSQPYGKDRLGRDQKLVELSDTCSVTSQEGSQTKYFDFLVCAAPLGVLKESIQRAGTEEASDTISFQPCLPFSKIDAISNVGFGLLDKVFVHFPTAFWRQHDLFKEDDQCLFGNISGINPHHYMFFDIGKCLGSEENPPAILMSLISGKEAVACERLTDAELVDEVVSTLKTIFSEVDVPTPLNFRITRWGCDKYSRGSYTFLPPGATDQDFQLLQSPINGNGDSLTLDSSETMRMFFAGEHTTSLHPSMAHGAMLSGMRAGKELAASISFKSRDEKDVDKMIPVALFRHKSPTAPLQCSFCHGIGGQVREGSLIAFKRGARIVLAHNNCAENSPEVEVVDFKWKNVVKAVNRGKGLNCTLCSKNGATIGCTAENCFRVFHFGCSEDTGWRFERDGKIFYCDRHRRILPDRGTECDRVSMKYFLTKMPTSSMTCGLCKSSEENMFYGSLLAFQSGHRQICVHSNCMKHTNIIDPGEVEGSRMGQEYSNVFLAVDQSKSCCECQEQGATISCSGSSCDRTFHLPCTRKSGWSFEKRGKGFRCKVHQARQHSKVEKVEMAAPLGEGATDNCAGFFQHNLLSQFGATSTAARESNPGNLDIGGTTAPEPTSPAGKEGESSDSEESFPGAEGSAVEVIDVHLTCDIEGSKKLVRIERSARTECWNMAFKVVEIEKTRLLSVASVPENQDDLFSLRAGDIVVSMNGAKIGSTGLQCLRDILLQLKEEVDMMVEVIRK
jgi:monoamine oxidase